jgi:hypothetical protein
MLLLNRLDTTLAACRLSAATSGHVRLYVALDCLLLSVSQRLQSVYHRHDYVGYPVRIRLYGKGSFLHFGKIEKVGNELQHPVDCTADFVGELGNPDSCMTLATRPITVTGFLRSQTSLKPMAGLHSSFNEFESL